jgi:hypothetical protein
LAHQLSGGIEKASRGRRCKSFHQTTDTDRKKVDKRREALLLWLRTQETLGVQLRPGVKSVQHIECFKLLQPLGIYVIDGGSNLVSEAHSLGVTSKQLLEDPVGNLAALCITRTSSELDASLGPYRRVGLP